MGKRKRSKINLEMTAFFCPECGDIVEQEAVNTAEHWRQCLCGSIQTRLLPSEERKLIQAADLAGAAKAKRVEVVQSVRIRNERRARLKVIG
jgi:hypothetical protein